MLLSAAAVVQQNQRITALPVACFPRKEENPDPLGLICFLRPAVASSVYSAELLSCLAHLCAFTVYIYHPYFADAALGLDREWAPQGVLRSRRVTCSSQIKLLSKV